MIIGNVWCYNYHGFTYDNTVLGRIKVVITVDTHSSYMSQAYGPIDDAPKNLGVFASNGSNRYTDGQLTAKEGSP